MSAHHGQHGPDCFGCKLQTVQFGPTKAPQSLMERRWERDMPAYWRLRQNGLQPPQIDGSAALEAKANTQLEVEMGDLLGQVCATTGKSVKKVLPQVAEGMAISRDLEWTPQESVKDMKDRAGVSEP